MNPTKRKALEAAGYWIGDAADFLGLSDEERQFVELRLSLSRAIRRRRQRQKLTQEDFARKLGSSQSRVAKIEAAAPSVSLDLMFKGLFALGGGLADLRKGPARPARPALGTKARATRKRGLKAGVE